MHIGKIPANQGYVNNLDLDFNIFISFAVPAAPRALFLLPHRRAAAKFPLPRSARRRAQ
jgi:hypothetical protein